MKKHGFWVSIFFCSIVVQCQFTHKHQQTTTDTHPMAAANPKSITAMDTFYLKNCPSETVVSIKQGQTLVCQLKAYPSKGYSWLFDSKTHNLTSVQFNGRTVQKATTETLDGAATLNIFTFEGQQKGTDTLTFKYLRPFDPPSTQPLETCVFKIHVE
ncbi:MAG: protease inhibitor I42 family protein [Saprospiraceae bacterium]|nr:protease inhibitor I42 family protein [Saprospiraceae bacterium]